MEGVRAGMGRIQILCVDGRMIPAFIGAGMWISRFLCCSGKPASGSETLNNEDSVLKSNLGLMATSVWRSNSPLKSGTRETPQPLHTYK